MYQYVTVKMPFAQGNVETVWTERINAVAREGWRLVSISDHPGNGITTSYATFEREVPDV